MYVRVSCQMHTQTCTRTPRGTLQVPLSTCEYHIQYMFWKHLEFPSWPVLHHLLMDTCWQVDTLLLFTVKITMLLASRHLRPCLLTCFSLRLITHLGAEGQWLEVMCSQRQTVPSTEMVTPWSPGGTPLLTFPVSVQAFPLAQYSHCLVCAGCWVWQSSMHRHIAQAMTMLEQVSPEDS